MTSAHPDRGFGDFTLVHASTRLLWISAVWDGNTGEIGQTVNAMKTRVVAFSGAIYTPALRRIVLVRRSNPWPSTLDGKMFRKSLLALGVLFLSSNLIAQEQNHNLKWKFTTGETFYMTEVMQQNQIVKSGGSEQKNETTQTTVTEFKVMGLKSDGGVSLKMTMLSVREDGSKAKNPGSQAVLDRMKGAEFQVELNSAGKIQKFAGYNDFVNRISGGNAAMAKIFRSILSEDSFRKMVTQTFSIVPGGQTKKGAVWKQNQIMTLGPFGNVAIVRNIQHSGEVTAKNGRKYVQLDLRGNARYQAPQEEFPNLPFRILGGDLKFDGITGRGYFDPSAGRLQQLTVEMKMQGTLDIQAGGQEEKVQLIQSQKGTVKISSANPLQAKSTN